MEIIKQSPKALIKAASTLKRGGVVICPTDTVYGFLADALNKKAVEKIYRIKKRTKSKPLPLFVKDLKTAKAIAEIGARQEEVLKQHWPGKHTFVLKRKQVDVGRLLVYGAGGETIAIRIPKHKFLNDLLQKINKPLAQTSVNLSNKPPLTKAGDIKKFIAGFAGMSGSLILIVDGGHLKRAKPSKIIDLTGGENKILRK